MVRLQTDFTEFESGGSRTKRILYVTFVGVGAAHMLYGGVEGLAATARDTASASAVIAAQWTLLCVAVHLSLIHI